MPKKSLPPTLPYDEARAAGHKRYLGRQCKKCGSPDKLVSNKFCYPCHNRIRDKWSAENRERLLQTQRDWAKKNYEATKERRKANGTYLADPVKKHRYEQKRKAENPEQYKAWCRKVKQRRAHLLAFDDASRRYYMNSPTRKTLKHLTREEKEKKVSERVLGCAYCGEADRLALDHINPISRGGAHEIDNFQWLCNHHNSQKNTKTHDEYVLWCIERDIPLPLVYSHWPQVVTDLPKISPWESFLTLASQPNVD